VLVIVRDRGGLLVVGQRRLRPAEGARYRHRIASAQRMHPNAAIVRMQLQIPAKLARQRIGGPRPDRWRRLLVAAEKPREQRQRRLRLRVIGRDHGYCM